MYDVYVLYKYQIPFWDLSVWFMNAVFLVYKTSLKIPKTVIRIRITQKDKQHNGQKKKKQKVK